MYRSLFAFLYFSAVFFFAQSDTIKTELENVIVTASRIPVEYSSANRTIEVLKSSDLKILPAENLQDVLQYTAGIDLKQRGVAEVQSDISIRGGSFEHTLIMIDGVRISDPQTGHHNLNLPVTMSNVARIEILKGPGTRFYGPNAFSGIVNFITKNPSQNSAGIKVSGGNYGYYKIEGNASYRIANFTNSLSVSQSKSDGYIHNTNFDITKYTNKSRYVTSFGSFNLFIGAVEKEYGANSFYTTVYPNQFENTKTRFANLSVDISLGSVLLSSKAYWRKNNDDFMLNYLNPAFYENLHETIVSGAELSGSFTSFLGKTMFGIDYNSDKIASSNLGNHTRRNIGLFFEQGFEPVKNLSVTGGLYTFNYSSIGWKISPGFDAGYSFGSNRLVLSYGQAFRIPTYTELFYSSPTTLGNADLDYEESSGYEIGFVRSYKTYRMSLSYFANSGVNLIDWVRTGSTAPWNARNIANVKTSGIDVNFTLVLNKITKAELLSNFNLGVVIVNSSHSSGSLQSRYILDNLKNQIVAGVRGVLPLQIGYSILYRYEQREGAEAFSLMDLSFRRQFGEISFSIKATNVLNVDYSDVLGVKLPGRWIIAGFGFEIGEEPQN